jgi:protocatechuate 3,4-dioxygenase beta subunit
MKSIHKALLGFAVAVPLVAFAAGGAKSGLAVGDMVSAFSPTHVTGPDAGTQTCPVCKYGKTPAVQVWVNGDKMENVAKIADTLEASIKMEGSTKLKGFIIYIKPAGESSEKLAGQLKMVADKCHLTNVGLLYVDSKDESVGQYKINTASSVKNTVLVYHDMKVSANFVNLKADEAGIKSLKGAMMNACGM